MNSVFCLQTFGCKSNQYESQGIRENLLAAGYLETADPGGANILVLNSCGVTGRAGASCRNAVRKATRANPGLRVVLTGCGVDLDEQWPDIPSGPPLCVPNAKKHALVSLLARWLATDGGAATPADDRFGLSISRFAGHTRAFLKIQDGCDNHCSYCAIPRARGEPQSRPPSDVLEEAKRLAGNGHQEIVLTGINIGVYRHGNTGFADLVAELAGTPGMVRLRLGSVEPPQMDRRLAEVMAADARICPHVHLPMQSGDDGVLSRMGRRYDASAFLDKVRLLQGELRHPAVTTDVIVGFPGEDEKAFEASAELCRRASFSRLHVFLFSPRPGTPAAAMKRSTPEREIEKWKTGLIAVGRDLAREYAAKCVGLRERVIVEKGDDVSGGLSDRYVSTALDGDYSPGSVLEVDIFAADDAALRARVIDR